MTTIKNIALALSIALLSTGSFAQTAGLNLKTNFENGLSGYSNIFSLNSPASTNLEFQLQKPNASENTSIGVMHQSNTMKMGSPFRSPSLHPSYKYSGFSKQDKEPFFKNRRNVYSSLWAYASLNYLYADLVGLMDANVLAQYQTGVVNGANITPGFLTVAAGFMQIPIANVFLPQLIKNERTLRVVQIVSGTIMTLVQSGTLFVGRPTPYYALFSAFEIAATTYITIDAFKWKIGAKKPRRL